MFLAKPRKREALDNAIPNGLKNFLYEKYIVQEMSQADISNLVEKEYGTKISQNSIGDYLRYYKIPSRTPAEGSGTDRQRQKLSKIQKDLDPSGERNANYKGGIRLSKEGYRLILIHDIEHPFKVKNYILEHRLVMENYLKENFPNHDALIEVEGYDEKYLSRKYEVHHKNEDITDNSIENLEVLTAGEHRKTHLNNGYRYPKRPEITVEIVMELKGQGLTTGEIAKLLDCNVGTIQHRIRRSKLNGVD